MGQATNTILLNHAPATPLLSPLEQARGHLITMTNFLRLRETITPKTKGQIELLRKKHEEIQAELELVEKSVLSRVKTLNQEFTTSLTVTTRRALEALTTKLGKDMESALWDVHNSGALDTKISNAFWSGNTHIHVKTEQTEKFMDSLSKIWIAVVRDSFLKVMVDDVCNPVCFLIFKTTILTSTFR